MLISNPLKQIALKCQRFNTDFFFFQPKLIPCYFSKESSKIYIFYLCQSRKILLAKQKYCFLLFCAEGNDDDLCFMLSSEKNLLASLDRWKTMVFIYCFSKIVSVIFSEEDM